MLIYNKKGLCRFSNGSHCTLAYNVGVKEFYLPGACVWVPCNWIILKVWWTVTLEPFDLQRLIVPLLKDLNFFCWCIVWPGDWQHFKDRFFFSKWPYFSKCLCYMGVYLFCHRCSIIQKCPNWKIHFLFQWWNILRKRGSYLWNFRLSICW